MLATQIRKEANEIHGAIAPPGASLIWPLAGRITCVTRGTHWPILTHHTGQVVIPQQSPHTQPQPAQVQKPMTQGCAWLLLELA